MIWERVFAACVLLGFGVGSATAQASTDGGMGTPPAATTGGSDPSGQRSPAVDAGLTVTTDTVLTQQQKQQLLRAEDQILHFVSKDTHLPIEHAVKCKFISRDAVNAELRKQFDRDKSVRRMERSELVLKKFGLLDRDFHLRPFLLSLMTEQIAGYYDDKTKQMTLLDWVPIEEQKPVMAHEITHALQDQKVDLEKWDNQEIAGIAKNVKQDNLHIANDDTDTAREAVLEGQAMVSFADYMLAQSGPPGHPSKTLRNAPGLARQLESNSGDMSDSPILARAPLVLQESLLFPYTAGLAFEEAILRQAGVDRAFAGVLDAPPSTSFQIMTPEAYLRDRPVPAAEKQTTASLALLYSSQWKNEDSARSFFDVFEQEMPRQYDSLTRRRADEEEDDERVYSTKEGDVFLALTGRTVWISEGFDLAVARKLRAAIDQANAPIGNGPIQQARAVAPDHDLVGGLIDTLSQFGVMKAELR